jgi:cation diffusion facilitator family transporter
MSLSGSLGIIVLAAPFCTSVSAVLLLVGLLQVRLVRWSQLRAEFDRGGLAQLRPVATRMLSDTASCVVTTIAGGPAAATGFVVTSSWRSAVDPGEMILPVTQKSNSLCAVICSLVAISSTVLDGPRLALTLVWVGAHWALKIANERFRPTVEMPTESAALQFLVAMTIIITSLVLSLFSGEVFNWLILGFVIGGARILSELSVLPMLNLSTSCSPPVFIGTLVSVVQGVMNPVQGVLVAGPALVLDWRTKRSFVDSGEHEEALLTRVEASLPKLLESPRERKLFYFLILTAIFMAVEFIYGLCVNSLGLVSDSFHMLLDAASIALTLYSVHLAALPRTETYPFGFGRYEILSGFTNATLLLLVAVFVFFEAIERVMEPPSIDQNYLVGVSVLGLVVNIVGLFMFSSDGHAHSHSHGGQPCCASTDLNLRALYLHILADFLGSVSVIVSSAIVTFTGSMAADPICSAFIACLIFASAIPVVTSSGAALLLQSPVSTTELKTALGRFGMQVHHLKVWTQSTTPNEQFIATLKISTAANSVKNAKAQVLAQLKFSSPSFTEENVSVQVQSL